MVLRTMFEIKRIPNIIAGPGKIDKLPGLMKLYGDKAVVVLGASSFISSSFYKRFEKDIKETGIEIEIIFSKEEPKTSFVDDCISRFRCKEIGCNCFYWRGKCH